MTSAEHIAREFHVAYEELAPAHGYATREASAKPWGEVPEQNRNLMIATVQRLLDRNAITYPNRKGPTMTAGSVELPHSGVTFHPHPATVGRAVHYTSHATEAEQKACRHATVTVAEDGQGRVGLCVTHPSGHEFLTAVEGHHIDENDPDWPRLAQGAQGRQSGTWHWPERV